MPPQAPPQRNEIVEWFQSIPPITKAIFTLSVVSTVAPALGLIDPYAIILSWKGVAKFQLWRLVTSFFFNRLGLGFAMNLYFMYRYSIQLENEVFQGRTADYVYFYVVTGVLQLVQQSLENGHACASMDLTVRFVPRSRQKPLA
ncbi:Der1-like family-domain-containing protein [Dichotomocladium elegans]|nr:Der1-like family-domain-containing protein [Dichotomocladium elegans]